MGVFDLLKSSFSSDLFVQVRAGNKKKFDELVANGACLTQRNDEGHTLLTAAIEAGHEDIAISLITSETATMAGKSAKPPVISAIEHRMAPVVEDLLSAGATPDTRWKKGPTAYELALTSKDPRIVAILVKQLSLIDGGELRNQFPLHYACGYEDVKFVEGYLDAGFAINSSDKQGNTPLSWAVRTNNLKAAKCLVKRGADVHRPLSNGDTLVHFAHRNNGERWGLHQASFEKVLQWLVKDLSLDINAKNDEGQTPLHQVLSADMADFVQAKQSSAEDKRYPNGKKAMDKLLSWLCKQPQVRSIAPYVALGADLTVTDRAGNSLLHMVRDCENCDLLMQKGLSLKQKNASGYTAGDMARTRRIIDPLVISRLSDAQKPSAVEVEGLLTAVKNNDAGALKSLLEAHSPVFSPRQINRCAKEAIELGSVDMLAVLSGIPVEGGNALSSELVALAVKKNDLAVTQALVENSCPLNHTVVEGVASVDSAVVGFHTCLDLAVREQKKDIARAIAAGGGRASFERIDRFRLIVNGITDEAVNRVVSSPACAREFDALGRTILHVAALTGQDAYLRLILEKIDLDLDEREFIYGATPLHLAVLMAHDSTARLLIDAGADKNGEMSIGIDCKDLIRFRSSPGPKNDFLTRARALETTLVKAKEQYQFVFFDRDDDSSYLCFSQEAPQKAANKAVQELYKLKLQ